VLTDTYRFRGSEIELLELGLIRVGALDGIKARLLVSLCLAVNYSRERIAEAFSTFGMTSGPSVTIATRADCISTIFDPTRWCLLKHARALGVPSGTSLGR
jgi:hypothetical protein